MPALPVRPRPPSSLPPDPYLLLGGPDSRAESGPEDAWSLLKGEGSWAALPGHSCCALPYAEGGPAPTRTWVEGLERAREGTLLRFLVPPLPLPSPPLPLPLRSAAGGQERGREEAGRAQGVLEGGGKGEGARLRAGLEQGGRGGGRERAGEGGAQGRCANTSPAAREARGGAARADRWAKLGRNFNPRSEVRA